MAELNYNLQDAVARGPVYEPLEAAAIRQQTLRNAILQNQHAVLANQQGQQALQAGDIKLQEGGLDLEQKRVGLRDQQIWADALARRAQAQGAQPTPGAPAPAAAAAPATGAVTPVGSVIDNGMINDLAKAGMSGAGLRGVIEQGLKQQETQSIAQKNFAQSSHYGAQTQLIKTQAVGQAANAVLALPPEQRAEGYARARQGLIQGGYATPDQIPEAYPGDTALQQHANDAVTVSAQLENQIKSAAEARAAAIAPALLAAAQTKAQAEQLALVGQTLGAATNQAQWDAARAKLPADVQAQTPAMFSPEAANQARQAGLSAEQQTSAAQQAATLAQTRIRDANTALNEAVIRQQGQQRLGIEGSRLGLERQRLGFDLAGGVSPAAQMAADGRMSPASVRAMLRSQPGMRAQILQVDPNFDEANIENRYNTLKEFTNTSVGKAGGQALALNTLIHHADLYLETAKALQNGTFVPGNEIYNKVATAFGAAPPQTADLVARFFAGETGKLATGGIPAESEVNGILKNMANHGSPKQMQAAGNALLGIAAGKASPLMQRAKQAKIDNVIQVLDPDAQSVLKRRGFNPDTMQQTGGAAPKQNPYR